MSATLRASSGLGAMMAGGNPAEGRKQVVGDKEYYPTPVEVTARFMEYTSLPGGAKVWEPCCGCGQMARVLERRYTVVQSDIEPRNGQAQLDFFDTIGMLDNSTAIITNPPFSLAERMIRHAWIDLQVDYMALLLKATFFHAAGRLPLLTAAPLSQVMPLTWRPDFLGLGRPTMEVAWFVWDRQFSGKAPTVYFPIPRGEPMLRRRDQIDVA